MPNIYTQEQIDHAIAALESWAGRRTEYLENDSMRYDAELSEPYHDNTTINTLMVEAWCGVADYENDSIADALEAAARLREGKLPGTPEWTENDSDTE